MVQENGAQNSPYLISRQRDYNAGLDTSHVPALNDVGAMSSDNAWFVDRGNHDASAC